MGSYPKELRERIYKLREENEGWGAISILVELEEFYGYTKADLPSSDSINRYLHQRGMIKAKEPKGKQPQGQSIFAKECHDLWELDAQGAVAVKGLGYISMINI